MISIIVPVYNVENRIERCIESILNQTYKDLELILIDDGSTDGSAEVCKKYAEMDSRIRFVQQENRGVSSTRNRGISMANGEYIQFVDSDDCVDSCMSEKLVACIEKAEADMVICGITEIFDSRKEVCLPKIEGCVQLKDWEKKYPQIFETSLLNSPCNKLYRKKTILEKFPKEVSLGEDLIFNLHNLKVMEKVFFLRESLYSYMIRSGSLNRKYRADGIECAENLYKEKMEFSHMFHLGKIAEKDISSTFIMFLFYGLSDLYTLSDYDKQQKRAILRKWINNTNVRQAARCANMKGISKKVTLYMTKCRMHRLLELLFFFRSKMRKG